ncbi:MAG: 1-deoxy-D-xylulose-5-phosphate synthase, partial [Clostridia bacterium]|nr:1-deoxy-D-xylulose-5-phosphate synthase [Clostridia bacterium]
MVVNETLFENLGWVYLGVADGNDISKVETVLREAKKIDKCCLVHIRTKKGKGYAPAEKNPCTYHGVPPFDPEKGVVIPDNAEKSFSQVFGDCLCELASRDKRICAVTAAMAEGTCLEKFRTKYRDRFFDVGIAEEHAATFCAALASKGLKAVFAVYSTFAQRSYDQIIHDAALQDLPVVFALDRAGLTPSDGATHHGLFDVSFFESIPDAEIYSPETAEELRRSLENAVASGKVSSVRYPKDREHAYGRNGFLPAGNGWITYCDLGSDIKNCIVTYGRLTENVYKASLRLANSGIGIRIIKAIKLKPLDSECFYKLTDG